MGILKTESYRRGAIYSTSLNLVARGIGFINALLIIYIFGAGLSTDIFFLILATVTLLTSLINGIDLLILIPEAMRLRNYSGEAEEKRFLNFFIRAYAGIGLLISLFIILAPVLFYSLFSEYSTDELFQKNQMLWLSAFLFPIQLLNSLFISILTSNKYFTIPMISALVNSIVSIILLLTLNKHFGVTGAVIATLCGYFVNFIWLALYMSKELNWNFFSKAVVPAKKFVHNIILMLLNIFPVSLRSYITTLLITGLGAGIITAYNYGYQLSLLPHGLIATQLVAVAGVKLNELSSRREHENLNKFIKELLSLLYFILFPIAAMMALTSHEIVTVLFGQSTKIEKSTLDNIALVIFFMALTLPNLALDIALSRLIMAQQKIKEGVLYAVLIHVVFVILVFTGIKLYGLTGFLIAYFTGNNIFLPALYYFLLKKATPFIEYTDWVKSSLPFIFFNLILVAGMYFMKKKLLEGYPPIIIIGMIGVVYTIAILVFNRFARYFQPVNLLLNKFLPAK